MPLERCDALTFDNQSRSGLWKAYPTGLLLMQIPQNQAQQFAMESCGFNAPPERTTNICALSP